MVIRIRLWYILPWMIMIYIWKLYSYCLKCWYFQVRLVAILIQKAANIIEVCSHFWCWKRNILWKSYPMTLSHHSVMKGTKILRVLRFNKSLVYTVSRLNWQFRMPNKIVSSIYISAVLFFVLFVFVFFVLLRQTRWIKSWWNKSWGFRNYPSFCSLQPYST